MNIPAIMSTAALPNPANPLSGGRTARHPPGCGHGTTISSMTMTAVMSGRIRRVQKSQIAIARTAVR